MNRKDLADADWKTQLKNLITEPEQLLDFIDLSEEEQVSVRKASQIFPMAVTPYYASLMERRNHRCPIRMQAVPTLAETSISSADMDDPLSEEHDSPVPGITHRYPDRVLLLVSHQCAVFCRHCTRKRRVGDPGQSIDKAMMEKAFEYIESRKEIRDVLISGGDPFLLSTNRLDWILTRLRQIPHVEIVRIGTRTPVVLPQRIDDELVTMLKKHHPLWINTHFNHPSEVTPRASEALAKLADAGIPLGNQSVILRDVNDCPLIMQNLVHRLVQNRVRPYYMYQCDLSRGIEHFRTPIAKGIEIMEMLIGHTSGLAVPTFVVDAPGGGGKIPLTPNYILSSGPRKVVLRNYEGVISLYTEPRQKETTCPVDCEWCDENMPKGQRWAAKVGLGKLFDGSDSTISLVPEETERAARRTPDNGSEE